MRPARPLGIEDSALSVSSGTFVGGALVFGSVSAVVVAAFLRSRGRKQLSWEGVDGTITAARVTFDGEYYRPEIEYSYSYDGRALRGEKVRSFPLLVNWKGPARRVVAKYPPGSVVKVFVNPENPFESVLERGGDSRFLVLLLFIAAVFLIVGLALLKSGGGVVDR